MTASANRDRGSAGRRPPGGTWVAWVLLGFASMVLALLAVTPFVMEGRITGLLDYNARVLDPARRLSAELAAAHASEMVAIQGFLLSGDGGDRQVWRQASQHSRVVLDSLTVMTDRLSPDVRLLAFDVADAALQWRLLVEPVLEGGLAQGDMEALLPEGRRGFQRVQQATLALERGVTAEASIAAEGLRRASERQASITALLAILGLLAAGGLVGVAVRLRRLAGDVESRRLQAERARGEADAVLQATADGVFGVDVGGRCTFVNAAALRLLREEGSAMRGRDLRGAFQVEGTAHPVDAALSGEAPFHLPEVRVIRRDGTDFHASVSAVPVQGQGGSLATVLTLSDITEMRDTAQALRQAVAVREQVLAVVSHDLRTPVATVQAASELLTELELPPERQAEQLQIIRRAGYRADRMIRDLLDSVAVERGALSTQLEPMDAGGLPAEVAQSMAAVAERRRVHLVLDGGSPGPLPILGDSHRLLQAMENLVGNASRFTPADGDVMIRAWGREGEVILEVEDQGPGIQADMAESLFDPFVQLDPSDPRSAGLGLAIVRGIAESHRGRVEFTAAESGGAIFRLIVPRAQG